MTQRKRSLTIVAGFLILLLALPCGLVQRQMEQDRKDQALIAAIKALDTPRALDLLAKGADSNAYDRGETRSLRQGLLRLLDRFRRSSASPGGRLTDRKYLTPLLLLYHHARTFSGPDITLVRALLDHQARVNERDGEGRTPLWFASGCYNVEAVRLLLERGAAVDIADNNGMTPLMDADAGSARILLEHGAAIEATDRWRCTALLHAANDGDRNLAQLLLEHGANVSARDATGRTAMDYARSAPDRDSRGVAVLLRKYGAR